MISSDLGQLRYQQTIVASLAFVGIGLTTGRRTTMRLYPERADHGVTIVRRDLPPGEGRFDVHWEHVSATSMCTAIGNAHGHQVEAVEHLLSALYALGIDNVGIDLDGPEVPVMDGSAAPFTTALASVGVMRLYALRQVMLIRRTVRLQHGESWAEFLPDIQQRVTISTDLHRPEIATQTLSFGLSPLTFQREIAPARIFGFAEQLEQLQRRGLMLGGSIDNALLSREGRIAGLEGRRFQDEFVRHQALDAIGDMALVGAPVIGHYRAHRPGHRLNLELLKLLMTDRDAWVRVPVDKAISLMAAESEVTARGQVGPPSDAAPGEGGPVNAQIHRLFGKES